MKKIVLPSVPNKGTIVPNMGTAKKQGDLTSVLFGKTRQALLSLFYSQPEESFYLRQVVRAADVGQGTVQRELQQLSEGGIIKRTKRGQQVYYQANRDCPVFAELRGLIMKTAGLADVLKKALKPLAKKIQVAFVYGSFAANTAKASSDVDLMVIGSCSFGEVTDAIFKTQDKLGREVNPSVYPAGEFKEKSATGHHFIKTVMAGAKIFLIGDENELKRLAQ